MDILNTLVGIVGTILGAIGVILTMISNRKSKKLKSISWSDIQSATKYFWRELKKEKFEPEIIITPGQKGGIVAQLISDFYDRNIPIFSGFLESVDNSKLNNNNYMVISTTKWNVYIPISVKDAKNKDNIKLLIVDDFVMSGDFLYKLKSALLELGYLESNIRSCALAVTKVAIDAKKSPNYYWKTVYDGDFYFPWGKAK